VSRWLPFLEWLITVNFEKAEVRVAASLQERVDLRLKVAGQYARHGLNLYDGSQEDTMALLWVLNLSDGDFSLLDIAERAKMPFVAIKHAANRLSAAGLLCPLTEQPE
jgi:aminopeptidase-like protein